jgi:hypothetical protein
MRSGVERLARRPVEAAARSSRSVLAAELDRALTLLLAGSIPERVVQGVIDHRVVERIVEQAAPAQIGEDDWAAVERAVERVLADERVARGATQLAERVVSSAAFEHALASVLESPEVRRAAHRQAVGFRSELGAAVRVRCARWDDALGARTRRLVHRQPAGQSAAFGGVVARGVALVVDLALAAAGFAAAVGAATLVGSLVGLGARPLVAAIGLAVFWTFVATAYFVTFWSATGQTPGMRALRLRVVGDAARFPTWLRGPSSSPMPAPTLPSAGSRSTRARRGAGGAPRVSARRTRAAGAPEAPSAPA